MLRVLDLFSGIGGFSLGLERAGMRTVAFCEIEEYPRTVLAKHWPGVAIYTDVRELTAARLAADGIGVDVICGGFPCQDISIAGSRIGIEGSRSGLWSEYARLIGELRPRYVIVENVAALLDGGMGRVLGDLAEIGYDAEWDCFPACWLGAPHSRDRVYIVSYTHQERRGARLDHLPDRTGLEAWEAAKGKCFWGDVERWLRSLVDTSDWLKADPSFLGVDDGLSARLDRIAALGNAVVPQIPEIIGRAILEAEGMT